MDEDDKGTSPDEGVIKKKIHQLRGFDMHDCSVSFNARRFHTYVGDCDVHPRLLDDAPMKTAKNGHV